MRLSFYHLVKRCRIDSWKLFDGSISQTEVKRGVEMLIPVAEILIDEYRPSTETDKNQRETKILTCTDFQNCSTLKKSFSAWQQTYQCVCTVDRKVHCFITLTLKWISLGPAFWRLSFFSNRKST